MDNNQRQKMERWADRGEHGGATALMDRLSSSLSSSSAPLVPERRVRPLHGFVVAAGAAVLTVVVIVAGVLAVRLGPEDEVATPDSAPAPVDVVTTVPAPDAGNVATTQPTTPIAESVVPADIDLTTWAEVPLNSDVFGYEPVYDAEWVDGILYAVGSSNEEEGEFASFRGTVWRSPDGITWERTATVSDPGSVMYAIAGFDTTLVAVGEIMLDGSYGAIWTSHDGDTWMRVPHDDDIFGGSNGQSQILEVTAGGPGFIAVGFLCDDCDNRFAGQPTVWVSENGENWTRLPFLENSAGVINDIASQDGTLVAVGSVSSESGVTAAIWTSDDGYTWERVVFGGAGDQWINGVTSSEGGFVAVGAVEAPARALSDRELEITGGIKLTEAVVWSSPTGRVWTISESYTADWPASAAFVDVATVGSQYVIVGRQFVFIGPNNEDEIREMGLVGEMGMVWMSSDGSSWTRADTGEQFFSARPTVVTGNPAGAIMFADLGGQTVWRAPPD